VPFRIETLIVRLKQDKPRWGAAVSQINLASSFTRALKIQLGADQWRARRASRIRPFCGDSPERPGNRVAYARRIPVAPGETLGKGSDELTIRIQAQNLEAREAALGQTPPIVLDGTLLSRVSHYRLRYVLKYIQI
jgi:hypothetical protein